MVLSYTLLVISFARCREYIICLISFNKFSDALPAFTCARAIGNHWSFCFVVNILRPLLYFALYLASDSKRELSLKESIIFSLKSEKFSTFRITLIWSFDFDFLFPFFIFPRSDLKLVWSFNTSFGFILPFVKSLDNSIGFW